MKEYIFNGRPFLLNTDKVWKREQQVYELLVQDFDEDIVYPYQVETADGQQITRWRHLTADEVQVLLNNDDDRMPVYRLEWNDEHKTVDGKLANVKRVAPIAHFKFNCAMVDTGMQVSRFQTCLTVEEVVLLTLQVADHYTYSMKDLAWKHADTHQRIMSNCPQSMSEAGRIIFSTAEKLVALLAGFGEAHDEVSIYGDLDSEAAHVVAHINEKMVTFDEESVKDFDITQGEVITLNQVKALCQAIGAYTADGLFQALEVMLQGSDGTLAPIKALLAEHSIPFTVR